LAGSLPANIKVAQIAALPDQMEMPGSKSWASVSMFAPAKVEESGERCLNLPNADGCHIETSHRYFCDMLAFW
jgi:hypothetical protein